MNPTHDSINPHKSLAPEACPNCDSDRVTSRTIQQGFTYGVGASAVQLTATVPQQTCHNCGFVFYDEKAETARHEAVCSHLHVLSPREIQRLRSALGLSRAGFADLTGLGDATIARWERGEMIQNSAYDLLLRLLGYSDNVVRTRSLQRQRTQDIPAIASFRSEEIQRRLRDEPDKVRNEQNAFRLRDTHARVA